ncbi:hypothetical protein ACWGJT_27760 [Streptomyces xantholiticus]
MSGPPRPTAEPAAEALPIRVLPESETGLARHSGASRRDIALTGTTEHARLAVTDSGHGPDPSDVSGSGLHDRAERLTAAGGRLASEPEPQGGFRVTGELSVPVVT